MSKRRKIEERIETNKKRLANAEEYVARNVNVEGLSFLHTVDWNGKSGHPLWMKNVMIPSLQKRQAKNQKALDRIGDKDREKLKHRKRQTRHA
jgi:hypothetical protein